MKKFQSITFVDSEGDEAIILPVSPEDLIQETAIGPRVSTNRKQELGRMLSGSKIHLRVRE